MRSRVAQGLGVLAIILTAVSRGRGQQTCAQLSGVFSATITGSTSGEGATGGSCGGGGAPEATFFYTAPRSGTYVIDTSNSSFDTVLYVRDQFGGELPGGCNDDIIPGDVVQSRVTVSLTAGQFVSVVVDGFGSASGSFVLRINGNCPQADRNDPRDLGSALSVSVSGTTTCGSYLGGGASCGNGGDNAPDATFLFRAPAAGAYVIDTLGSDFDTVLSVRASGCGGTELPGGCSDDIEPGSNPQSRVNLNLETGEQAFIVVDGYDGASGHFFLNINGTAFTPTRTATRTRTPSNSPTASRTRTSSPTRTATRSATRTATATRSASPSPTRTRTRTATPSASPTPTTAPSGTATPTSTTTATRTLTTLPTATVSPTHTTTPTQTSTVTATPTPTATLVPTAVVIDFEILAADGPGQPAAVLATGQYAARGVTFNGPVALDYSRGSAIPGFAHSGTKAIEPCYGQEFCTTPIEMTFSVPQQRVKVWVGMRSPLGAPADVVLLAFDAAGAEIARGTASLAASATAQPISAPLEVHVPVAGIARAVVRFSPPTTLTNGLAVDDVEFDSAGSAVCGGVGQPTVRIDAPASGSSTQTNQLLLSGSIDTQAPLEAVELRAGGAVGTRALDLLAAGVVGRGGGAFGPLRVTGLLPSGPATVTLRARDCHGSGSATVGVTYEPIGADTRVTLTNVEVTQAVQDEHNGVPLIADKRTLVRAYLRTRGSTHVLRNVRGTLTACRPAGDDLPVCGEFFPKLYAGNTIEVDDSADLAAKRRDPNGSLNFELPGDWASAGLLHLQLADLEIDGLPTDVPCDRCDNPNVFGFPGFHQFVPTKPLSFLLFEVEYAEDGVSYVPRFTDVYHLRSWLERAYPVSRVIAPNISFNAGFDSVPSRTWVNANLFARKMATRSYNTLLGWFGGKVKDSGVYYGMVYDGGVVNGVEGPYFMIGGSNDTLGVGSGPTGFPPHQGFNWDADESYGDWYGGHEIGHMHGRAHPGFVRADDGIQCVAGEQDSSPVDASFPYANGSIGNPGWDAGDAGLKIPARIMPPYTSSSVNGSTDVMTYCNEQWISDYTYRGILHRIDSSVALTALTAGETDTAADALVVTGTINLTRDTVDLAPFIRLPNVPLDPQPAASPYSIDLLDADGGLLARYPFAPAPDTEAPVGEDLTGIIGVAVPFDPATRTVVVAKDGVALATRSVSANAPQVHLLSPNGGETLQGATAPVTWEGEDLDGDALSYTVLYSTDGGATWFPVAVGLSTQDTVIHLDDLPGSDTVRLRVMATDGVNTSSDDSDGLLIVPPKAPEVHIVAPVTDAPVSTRQTVVFAGDAFDREDGTLDDESLHWVSDRQGLLGTGPSMAVTGLNPGHHVVTLAATDGDGMQGTAQVVIDVVAELPRGVIAAARLVARGTQVDLDAGSSAGSGSLAYRWVVAARPNGSDAWLTATDGVSTTLQTDEPGTYEVELIVRDAWGTVSVARVSVTAVPRGDCNGDLHVDESDLADLVRELFDGDGPESAGVAGGTFPGNPVGCDANGDGLIAVADLASTVMRLSSSAMLP